MSDKWDGLLGIGEDRAAQLEWALKPQDGSQSKERIIGSAHPSIAAHQAVREVLNELHFPLGWEAKYSGVKRASGQGAYGVIDGVIDMQVEFKSKIGAKHYVTVPVFVRSGRVLNPGVLVHNGRIRVITQNAIDDIVKAADLTKPVLDRKMFTPPSEDRRVPTRTPIVQSDMFHNFASIEEAYDVMGLAAALERVGAGIEPVEWDVDEAEREQPTWGVGCECRLKKDLDVPSSNGVQYHLPKGMKGVVRRMVCKTSDGDMWLVWFSDLHESFKVPGSALA
jgi:hypothetical protein